MDEYSDDFEEQSESPLEPDLHVSRSPLISLPRPPGRRPIPGDLEVTPQGLKSKLKAKRNSSYTKWKRKGSCVMVCG